MFAWLALAIGQTLAAQEPLYSGEFADGSFIAHGKLSEWHDTSAQPKLNGTPLFEPARPMRQLVCETAEAAVLPAAYIEYVGGDRLPCVVLEYRDGADNVFERLPPHLVVQPAVPIDPPGQPARDRFAAAAAHLRRVVWQRRGARPFTHNVAYLADGGRVAFRSLRWTADGVSLLLADGVHKYGFAEMAELHLGESDPWESYYATLAQLSPDLTSRLLRVDTYSGLAATTSLARFAARNVSGDQGGWYHLLQPSWALSPLWIRHATVQSRRSFVPHEPPLTWASPTKVTQRSALGGGWRWQVDRNVQGNPLRSGGRLFAFGIAQHADHELGFALPSSARAFRSQLGIDAAAGRGGCLRALIYANRFSGQPLFASKTLVGSSELLDTGPIDLGSVTGPERTLLLVAEANPPDRPAGADPLDVRDMLDWIGPQLLLDRDALQAEVDRHRNAAIAAWRDWQLSPSAGGLQFANRAVNANAWVGGSRLAIRLAAPTTLSRTVKLTERDRYLALAVARPEGSSPSSIELRADGKFLAGFIVPEERPQAPPSPLLVPLTPFAGREVLLEIEQTPAGEASWLDWRGLGTTANATSTPWKTPAPIAATAASGASLERLADGSYFVAGAPRDFETYTITADSDVAPITGIRLDVLADPRLPGGGPGRAGNGNWVISGFEVRAAPLGEPENSRPIKLARAAATFAAEHAPAALAIDDSPQSAWSIWPRVGQNQSAVFELQEECNIAGGARLTFVIDQRVHQQHAIGRFRLSLCGAPRPLVPEPLAVPAPMLSGSARTIFHDEAALVAALNQGSGQAELASDERFAGAAAIRITGTQRFNNQLPETALKIRRYPNPGEYRYLRFAWKLPAGRQICLQLAHDGQWGAVRPDKPALRYYAGDGPPPYGAGLRVADTAPRDWTLLTRDLYEEFGEFTFTGLSFDTLDAPTGYFDEIVLAPSLLALDSPE